MNEHLTSSLEKPLKFDRVKWRVIHKSEKALANNTIAITAVDFPATKYDEVKKKYEKSLVAALAEVAALVYCERLLDAKKSATYGVLDQDGLLGAREERDIDLKRPVITAFDEGLLKKEHKGYKIPLKRSKAVLSVLTDVDHMAYYKFVRYNYTFTSGRYLCAGIELQFPHGLGDHMFCLDVELSPKKDLPTEKLQLLFGFQGSSYWETLAEGVEYTLEEKKICYYFVQDSLHVVLNSSCHFELVDADVQRNTGNHSHKFQHPTVPANLTTNLSSLEENNSGRLLKNFRHRNSVKEQVLDLQIEPLKAYPEYKQLKARHHSQKLSQATVNVEEYIPQDYVGNLKISLIASVYPELVSAEVQDLLEASRTLMKDASILIESLSARETELKEDPGIVGELVDSCQSVVTISQALVTDDSGSEVAALLSAFVVALLSRLAQLRQEIAAGVQDLLERGGSESRVHKVIITSVEKTVNKTAIEAVEIDKLFPSFSSKLLKHLNSSVVNLFEEPETKDDEPFSTSIATSISNTSSQIECIPEMRRIKDIIAPK